LKNKFTIFVFSIILGIYAIVAANSIGKPLVADEWGNYSAAESIILTGKPELFGEDKGLLLGHPPLYPYIVAFFFKLFGIGSVQARFAGVAFFVLNLILVYFMSRNLYPKNRLAHLIALLFFGLSPLVVQGSLMIDIDQTLLTFSVTLFLYYFIKSDEWSMKKRILTVALGFFLVMWSKLSIPPVLLFSMAVYYMSKKEYARGTIEILGILFIGSGLFLLSWWFYCNNLGFMKYFFTPFVYIFCAFFKLQIKGSLFQKLIAGGITLFRMSLWTSPFLLLLSICAMGKQSMLILKEKIVPRDFMLTIFAFAVLVGYLFVGGLSYGFPKTQSVAMPALAVLIAGNLPWSLKDERRNLTKLAIILVFVLLFFLVAVGDIIYLVHYLMKEALIYNFRWGFEYLILPLLSYAVTPFLVLGIIYLFFYHWRFIHKLLMVLAITTLAANLSLNALQAKADYITTAEYGGRDKNQLIYFLKGVLKQDDIVFSTSEIIYDVKSKKSPPIAQKTWNDPEEFLRFVREKEPRVIVYGIPLNAIEQFKKTLLNPLVLEFLQGHYKKIDIGSYTVWVSAG